jgi:hypothetical protein
VRKKTKHICCVHKFFVLYGILREDKRRLRMSATAAHAAAAAIAQAVKASGAIVKIAPEGFRRILQNSREPLVVTSQGGFFGKKFQYLMGYKGLVFFTSSNEEIGMPSAAEVVEAEKIWIPG